VGGQDAGGKEAMNGVLGEEMDLMEEWWRTVGGEAKVEEDVGG